MMDYARSTTSRRGAPEEALDEALRRGSPGALLSGLLLAIVFPFALWLIDYVPARSAPLWSFIKQEVILLDERGRNSSGRGSGWRTAVEGASEVHLGYIGRRESNAQQH